MSMRRGSARLAAVAPDFDVGGEPRDRLFAGVGERRLDDHPPRRGDLQAMRERLAAEGDVDEGDDGADLRQAEPQGEILRAIGHHQADRLALGDAGAQSPARILVHALREGAKIEVFALAQAAPAARPNGAPIRRRRAAGCARGRGSPARSSPARAARRGRASRLAAATARAGGAAFIPASRSGCANGRARGRRRRAALRRRRR